ncbi:MAG: nucleotide exchange factor GrpE [Myxococcota bacterium]
MGSQGNGNAARKAEDANTPEIRVIDRRHWASEADEASGQEEGPGKLTYVAGLERKLEQAEKLRSETLAQHQDAVAEFENARARLSREVGQEVERHKRAILVELLDVADNLERALEASERVSDVDALRRGVAMVRDQFMAKLEAFGVRRMQSDGATFDPEQHEAVTAVPVDGDAQDGVIVGVVKEGFTIDKDRFTTVLRPAQVAVGRAADSDDS